MRTGVRPNCAARSAADPTSVLDLYPLYRTIGEVAQAVIAPIAFLYVATCSAQAMGGTAPPD